MQEDFKWFVEHYDELFRKYGHSFLAIQDRTVIGVYESYAQGVKETAKTHKLGTFIVQECNGDPSGYTNYISSAFIAV